MTPDLDKRLRAAYPLVFPKPLLNDEPIRCGDGWYQLLDELCAAMTRTLEGLPPFMQERLATVQVKEKFGTLRFYLEDDDPTSPVAPLIRAAELASAKICDVCGNPATLRSAENTEKRYFWVRTRCDEHIDWREGVTGFAHKTEP